ncbi:hypothetical protein MW887_010889 [Aspergillus wentii]|nr:hypothetical protein MW887_010889 [Aspergillus wentii]
MELAGRSSAEPPSGLAVRGISKDVDTVFQISFALAPADEGLREWALAACAHAGAKLPILITAGRYLKRASTAPPPRIKFIQDLEKIALEDRDPRAMVLYAKVLGLREKFPEALALMDEVMQKVYPVKTQSADKGFFLVGIDTPWEIYAWLKEISGDSAGTDEIMKTAALVYQDKEALLSYALIMMQKGDYEMYEECMNKAASAGNAEACRKLANFYYLTYHGRFPRRGEKVPEKSTAEDAPKGGETGTEEKKGLLDYFSSMFLRIRPRAEYRTLALNWYELSFSHGDHQSALILALLLREEGQREDGFGFLELAEQSLKLRTLTQRFKPNWFDPEYVPKMPVQLLDV